MGVFYGVVFCVLVVSLAGAEILRRDWLLVAGVKAAEAERSSGQRCGSCGSAWRKSGGRRLDSTPVPP